LRLDELRERLDQERATAEQSRFSAEALHNDIAALQAANDEAAQATDAYRQARVQLERQRADIESAVKPVGDLVGSPDNVERLKQEWRTLNDELARLRDDLPAAEQKSAEARAAHESARAEADRAATAFQAVKDRPTSLAARLQAADDLRNQINDLAKSDREKAYVLLLDFDTQLTSAELKDVAAYQRELDEAWAALAKRQDALRTAGADEAKARAAVEQLTAKIERQESTAVDLVLQRAQAPAGEGEGAGEQLGTAGTTAAAEQEQVSGESEGPASAETPDEPTGDTQQAPPAPGTPGGSADSGTTAGPAAPGTSTGSAASAPIPS